MSEVPDWVQWRPGFAPLMLYRAAMALECRDFGGSNRLTAKNGFNELAGEGRRVRQVESRHSLAGSTVARHEFDSHAGPLSHQCISVLASFSFTRSSRAVGARRLGFSARIPQAWGLLI